MSATCHKCRRELCVGESAWAEDWTVIDADVARTEVRYVCEECA